MRNFNDTLAKVKLMCLISTVVLNCTSFWLFWLGCLCFKGKGLDTCYSAAYMSQTRDQQRFTISEVAADLA